MTKADLINVISEKAALQHKQAELVVNMVFDMMSDALKKDDRIEIRGFGSFVNRSYGSYQGRNPKTGVEVAIEPRRVMVFKPSNVLKARINGGHAVPDDDQELNVSINTTPLVDVMLVMLIIFLITVPVVTQTIAVNLPKETNVIRVTKPENIELSVSKDGDVYWNTKLIPDMEELVKRLDTYELEHGEQFAKVTAFIEKKIIDSPGRE